MTAHDPDRRTVILDGITDHIQVFGHPPSVRDLMEITGLATPSAVHYHLKAMEKAGQLRPCSDGCGRYYPADVA